MMTIKEFVSNHKVTMTVGTAQSNPNMVIGDVTGARHWLCILGNGAGDKMEVPFTQGSAHTEPPTVADVLDCLASDAAGIENADAFGDWATEYGYDEDSRKAEKSFKTCEKLAQQLKVLLGEDAYQALLWETERE